MSFARRPTLLALAAGTVVTACVRHNFPMSQSPNGATSAAQAVAYVDQDGTFYPPEWRARFGPPARRGAYSLRTIARMRGGNLQDSITISESRILDSLQRFVAPKRRVFILVHGFNNKQRDADTAYALIKQVIDAGPNDALISFYWDGLKAVGPLAAGRIWFPATGYSQLAGQRGLRRLLDRIQGKQVFFIAHSRGASVILSALSDPPYGPRFARETLEQNGIDVTRIAPLRENGNTITAVFLAPAIGAIDFRRPGYYAGDTAFRDLGAQVKRIHFTVNQRDPVLEKPGRDLSDNFNPTNLGFDPEAARQVQAHYPFMSSDLIKGLPAHAFTRYVTDSSFRAILLSAGVPTR